MDTPDLDYLFEDMDWVGKSSGLGIANVPVTMPHISMKKLYGLAYAWIVEEDSQGPSHKEAHRQVAIPTD